MFCHSYKVCTASQIHTHNRIFYDVHYLPQILAVAGLDLSNSPVLARWYALIAAEVARRESLKRSSADGSEPNQLQHSSSRRELSMRHRGESTSALSSISESNDVGPGSDDVTINNPISELDIDNIHIVWPSNNPSSNANVTAAEAAGTPASSSSNVTAAEVAGTPESDVRIEADAFKRLLEQRPAQRDQMIRQLQTPGLRCLVKQAIGFCQSKTRKTTQAEKRQIESLRKKSKNWNDDLNNQSRLSST